MTHYDVLEVSENASQEVIQMAYKALVKKYHPDVNKGFAEEAEQLLKLINEAYETLSDPEKRKEYDAFLYISRHEEVRQEKTNLENEKSTPDGGKQKQKMFTPVRYFLLIGIVTVLFTLIALYLNTSKTQAEAYYNTIIQNNNDHYALYDIDKDGTKELILTEGGSASVTTIHFYTWENDKIIDLGGFEFDGGVEILKSKDLGENALYYLDRHNRNQIYLGYISISKSGINTNIKTLYAEHMDSEFEYMMELIGAKKRGKKSSSDLINYYAKNTGEELLLAHSDSQSLSVEQIEEQL